MFGDTSGLKTHIQCVCVCGCACVCVCGCVCGCIHLVFIFTGHTKEYEGDGQLRMLPDNICKYHKQQHVIQLQP